MNRSITRKITARLFFRQFFGFIWLNIIIGLLGVAFVTAIFGYVGNEWQGIYSAIPDNFWLLHCFGWQIYVPAVEGIWVPLFFCGVVTLTIETLLLISHTVKNYRLCNRNLGSLDELARAADTLKQKVTTEPKPTLDGMKSLAGQLGKIDAERLDHRINVGGEHRELRDLAAAINGMLDRIDAAYHAQAQFVSDASHELRTPISVIQGYANLLDRWGKDDEKTLQESITAIKNETENMKDLVEQLLFLAKGDSDTIPLEPEQFDLADLASEIVNETSMIDQAHTFVVKGSNAFVNADRGLIKQAVRILVDNAIKYTDGGGEIIVSSDADGTISKIAVSDSGIGIPADVLPHVFERFTRADASRARATGGAGLGLAIAKWIVTRHDGFLEALSREGIGTRMTISLPGSYDYAEVKNTGVRINDDLTVLG